MVLERQESARTAGAGIGLWANAFRALDALGLAQSLREASPVTMQRWVQACSQLDNCSIPECADETCAVAWHGDWLPTSSRRVPVPSCGRMEYRKGATDKVIRSLQLSGPAHESRVVLRANLLSTLLSAVPEEAVHYNHRVTRAWTDAECALPCYMGLAVGCSCLDLGQYQW